jgi:hypothetical protein
MRGASHVGRLVLLAQLLEGLHPVGLLLEVELIDLLLGEIDDLPGLVRESRLPVALHDDRRDDALLGSLAAEHPAHPAEHALEPDERLFFCLHVGPYLQGDADDESDRQAARDSSRLHV